MLEHNLCFFSCILCCCCIASRSLTVPWTVCKHYANGTLTLLRNNNKGQSACPLEMQFSLDTFGRQLVESPDAEPWLWRAGCIRLQSRVERRAPRNPFSFKLSSRRVAPASSVVCLCCCHSWFLSNHLPAPPPAAPGFTGPPLCAEEAALRRALEHADGDHSSLIQIYEAFVQSKWLTLHPQTPRKYPISQQTSLCVQEEEALCRGSFFVPV